jgi:hypothetical protein
MTCVHGCGREATRGDECYAHYLKSVSFNYGQLRNRLYPGLTNRETEETIRAEAAAKGEDAVPADWI